MQEVDGSYRCLSAYQLPQALRPRRSMSNTAHAISGVHNDGNNDVGQGCNALSTVRGYLLASQGSTLVVYNTTDNVKILFTRSSSAGPSVAASPNQPSTEDPCRGSASPPRRWAALPSSTQGEDIVIEAKPCAKVCTRHSDIS